VQVEQMPGIPEEMKTCNNQRNIPPVSMAALQPFAETTFMTVWLSQQRSQIQPVTAETLLQRNEERLQGIE